ncbi:MAG TPA: hypothetical protein VGA37_14570 [Gemmatimonadales bacterium]
MTRWLFSTNFLPPAAIAYTTPPSSTYITNLVSPVSLEEARIRSSFEGAHRELLRYKHYQPRWDGYNAEPFAEEVLLNVAEILDYSQDHLLGTGTIPEVVTTGPASDGSIDIEIQVGGKTIFMTLYPQENTLLLSNFYPEGADERVVPLRNETLDEWLSWLRRSVDIPADVAQD